jgi:hypothetical protein
MVGAGRISAVVSCERGGATYRVELRGGLYYNNSGQLTGDFAVASGVV